MIHSGGTLFIIRTRPGLYLSLVFAERRSPGGYPDDNPPEPSDRGIPMSASRRQFLTAAAASPPGRPGRFGHCGTGTRSGASPTSHSGSASSPTTSPRLGRSDDPARCRTLARPGRAADDPPPGVEPTLSAGQRQDVRKQFTDAGITSGAFGSVCESTRRVRGCPAKRRIVASSSSASRRSRRPRVKVRPYGFRVATGRKDARTDRQGPGECGQRRPMPASRCW